MTISLLASSPNLRATDGYFEHGIGVKANGIGGAGVAYPQDSLAPGTNPAGDAFVGTRADFGLTYFRPDRGAELGGDFSGNGDPDFYIPEAGVNWKLGPKFTFGIALFGNGGLNTAYTKPIPALGTKPPGVDLEQVFLAPTLTYKITPQHAIGISPIIAYQRFKAHGLQNFGINDPGYDNSYGGGVRVGYTGELTDWLTIGATWQSRVYMSDLDRYKHLFAEHGNFDIPSNFAGGIAVRPIPKATIAFDVERILFSEVNSVGNKVNGQTFAAGLGADDGPGFGWRDVTVYKIGGSYDLTDHLTVRAGYNYTTQPIPHDQTFFNILAPAVVQHHITAGLTWRFSDNWELNAFYMHAFEERVEGSNNFNNANANLHMQQDAFGLGLGYKF